MKTLLKVILILAVIFLLGVWVNWCMKSVLPQDKETWDVWFFNSKATKLMFCKCPSGNPEDVEDKDCIEKTMPQFTDFLAGKVQVIYIEKNGLPHPQP